MAAASISTRGRVQRAHESVLQKLRPKNNARPLGPKPGPAVAFVSKRTHRNTAYIKAISIARAPCNFALEGEAKMRVHCVCS
jgi:hypothetical protein